MGDLFKIRNLTAIIIGIYSSILHSSRITIQLERSKKKNGKIKEAKQMSFDIIMRPGRVFLGN